MISVNPSSSSYKGTGKNFGQNEHIGILPE